jgi:uncharacterized membrane protein YeaQ/YmgE (transglycosylase-associated protein family)
MGLLTWMLIGLIAGALAKAFMPGNAREPQGCLLTMLLGMAGAVVMGFIADLFLGGGSGGLLPSIVGATLGAMFLIWLVRRLGGK